MDLDSINFSFDFIGPFFRNRVARAEVCLIIVLRVAYLTSAQAPSKMHYFDRPFPKEGVEIK